MNNIIENVIGGVLASVIFWAASLLIPYIYNCNKAKHFKNVFGFRYMKDDYPIFFGKMYSKDPTGFLNIKYKTNALFKVLSMTSNTDIRAYDYLKNVFSKEARVNVKACLDEDVCNPNSYCSIGCLNNIWTLKLLDDPKNNFYKFDNGAGAFVNKRTYFKYSLTNESDYGLILKITDEVSGAVQICVAGLGDFGTTGAAYYLAHRWKELEEEFGNRDFGCIIEVKNCHDASAKLVNKATNDLEINANVTVE